MTTRFRTWVLIAGLSGLFVTLGALVGGAAGMLVVLVLAVGFNLVMF